MRYPYNHLTNGETVLVHQHPHWKTLIPPGLATLVVVAGCAYLAALAAGSQLQPVAWIALGVVAAVAVAWFGLGRWLRWKTTHFVLTTDQIMFREGILSRTGMNIPLHRIASVQTEIDLNDRLFGCGTLVVESASAEPLRFNDIPAVEHTHTLLNHAIDGTTEHLTDDPAA